MQRATCVYITRVAYMHAVLGQVALKLCSQLSAVDVTAAPVASACLQLPRCWCSASTGAAMPQSCRTASSRHGSSPHLPCAAGSQFSHTSGRASFSHAWQCYTSCTPQPAGRSSPSSAASRLTVWLRCKLKRPNTVATAQRHLQRCTTPMHGPSGRGAGCGRVTQVWCVAPRSMWAWWLA
jgi:hypothetical protein